QVGDTEGHDDPAHDGRPDLVLTHDGGEHDGVRARPQTGDGAASTGAGLLLDTVEKDQELDVCRVDVHRVGRAGAEQPGHVLEPAGQCAGRGDLEELVVRRRVAVGVGGLDPELVAAGCEVVVGLR